MSESQGQNVSIVITDQVAASISAKLDGIGKSATAANATIDKLQAALGVLAATTSLDKVTAQLAGIQAAVDKAALSQTVYNKAEIDGAAASARLATAQQNTATAATRGAVAQAQLATATLRTATAQTADAKAAVDLSTAQTRGVKAASDAAAASDRAALAALRLQAAQEKTNETVAKGPALFGSLTSTLLAFAGIGAVADVVHLADEFQNLQNKIASLGGSAADNTQVFAALFQVAQETRAPIEQTVVSFQRLDSSLRSLGKSQADTISIVKTLNELIAASGPNATNAKNGILELDKAFGEGKLQGQQLRSILLDIPLIAQEISKNLTVTNGVVTVTNNGIGISVSQFRALATQGKITSDVLANALAASASDADKKFATLKPTILSTGSAFNVLQNDLLLLVGNIYTAINGSTALGAVVVGLTKDLPELAVGLTVVGVAALAAFGPGLLTSIAFATGAVISFSLALVSTPIGAIAIALGVAFLALTYFAGGFKNASIYAAIFVDGVVQGIDALSLAFVALLTEIPAIFKTAFDQAYAEVKGTLDNIVNAAIVGINKIRSAVGENPLAKISSPPPVDTSAYTAAGKKISAAFNAGLNDSGAGAVNELIKLYQPTGTNDLNQKRTALPAVADPTKTKSLGNGILNQEDPLRAYNQALQAAKQALDSGDISLATYNKDLLKASETYQNAIDPLRSYNKDLDQQLATLKLLPDQQAANSQLQQIQNKLLADGIVLTDSQTAALLKKIAAVKQETLASQAEAQLLANSNGTGKKGFQTNVDAISALQSNPAANFTSGDAATATTSVISSIGLDPKDLQVQTASYVSIYSKMYADIAALRAKDLISERDAQTLKLQVAQKQMNDNLNSSETFFSDLQGLSRSNNSALATIGKAASVANAIIHTYEAATAAYASLASVPLVGPELGAAAAAAAIVTGLASVAQIKSQPTGFQAGGYTGSGGVSDVAGVVHGQEYVLDAASVSRIGVGQLDALRAGAASVAANGAQAGKAQRTGAPAEAGQGQSNTSAGNTLNHTNVNVLDPKIVGDFLATPAGETATINLIRRNKTTINRALG